MITIDTNSPERGWPPFIEWLSNQGITPTDAKSITFDPESLTATVTLFKTRMGKHYVEIVPGIEGPETVTVAVKYQTVQLSSLPPCRSASLPPCRSAFTHD